MVEKGQKIDLKEFLFGAGGELGLRGRPVVREENLVEITLEGHVSIRGFVSKLWRDMVKTEPEEVGPLQLPRGHRDVIVYELQDVSNKVIFGLRAEPAVVGNVFEPQTESEGYPVLFFPYDRKQENDIAVSYLLSGVEDGEFVSYFDPVKGTKMSVRVEDLGDHDPQRYGFQEPRNFRLNGVRLLQDRYAYPRRPGFMTSGE